MLRAYQLNVALSIKGSRHDRGSVVELSDDDVANLDPADLTALTDVEASEVEPEAVDVPLEELSLPQLKERAKSLGLAATGSKADLQERITLHLEAFEPEAEAA